MDETKDPQEVAEPAWGDAAEEATDDDPAGSGKQSGHVSVTQSGPTAGGSQMDAWKSG